MKKEAVKPLTANILYDKKNVQGLKRDAEIIEACCRRLNDVLKQRIGVFRSLDPREHPVQCDVQFHVDYPSLANLSWARVNILLLNPGKFADEVIEESAHHFDFIVFRSTRAMQTTCAKIPSVLEKSIYIPWSTRWERPRVGAIPAKELVMFLGNSESKIKAGEGIIRAWKEEYPKLTIYTAKERSAALGAVPSWITLKLGNYTDDERASALVRSHGCVVVAENDGSPHTLLEALQCGSMCIVNDIDVYADVADAYPERVFVIKGDAGAGTDGAIEWFNEKCNGGMNNVKLGDRGAAEWKDLWMKIEAILPGRKVKKHVPPPIDVDKCPSISVVTLLYNRRKFFDIASHNMLLTDYPRSKIEWVLVDDSDDQNDSPSDKVIKFQNDHPEFANIAYVPLGQKTSIGAKRNIGVGVASNDIILMMDDDDHYPDTSFRRRVSWLKSEWPNGVVPSCCGCATIAMYDLVKAVSAVNVPPLNLSLGARLSEATLTFYKAFWEERKFGEIDMAEGEAWIKGREIQVMEMPPQQIIVAFNHKQNSSSRKIPDSADKGCFWGFPKEYLEFIHKTAGMEIEWQGN